MAARARVWRGVLVGVLVAALAAPAPVWSAEASLGTARGVGAAEMSLDGGKHWLPLRTQPLPVMPGARLRSTNGAAVLDLADGSRVDVLPFTAVRFNQALGASQISLQYGRLTFRLLPNTRVGIDTPTARLEPAPGDVMVGEVFAGGTGTTGVRMTQGSLWVAELKGGRRVVLAGRDPVFVPERPAAQDLLFSSQVPTAPPAGAKIVFNPAGQSVGYVGPNVQLVVQPGLTADLTRPFPARTVEVATARIPEKHRPDAVPLFDVNGEYVGYVAGPVFYAQTAPAKRDAGFVETLDEGGIPWYYYAGGAALAVGLGVGIAVAVGGNGGGGGAPPASPIVP